MHRLREGFKDGRTALINRIRGSLAEVGLMFPQSPEALRAVLADVIEDATRIDGIDVTTALVVVSEVGVDMARFPSDKHFACWHGLCPGTKSTGGKVMRGRTTRVANRAAQALKQLKLAASALRTGHSTLGAYYRRLCAHMDKPKAVTAAAHKPARPI